MTLQLSRICRALHPLDAAPTDAGWNVEEVSDLLVDRKPVPAAVLVGIVPRIDGLRVLLTRRTSGMRHHAGQVSFPGGRVEAVDRDPAAAAVRETVEEVGIQASQIEPIGYLDTLQTVTGFHVTPLVAVIAPDYVPRPDPAEVDEVFEVALDFLMDATNLRTIEVELRGRRRTVLEFADWGEGHRLWGVSASILFNLRQRMETHA